MNEFLEQFLIESRELVEQASDDLMVLDQAPDDHARLDSLFRGFHTLKGAAGIVEFAAMGRTLHAAEQLLAAVRAGESRMTTALISACLACLDQVLQWLTAMETEGTPPANAEMAADALIAMFTQSDPTPPAEATRVPLLKQRPGGVDRLLAAAPAGGAKTAIRYTPDADSFFRGEDPLALMAGLPGLLALDIAPCHPWPSLDDLDPFACNLIIAALSAAAPEAVADYLRAAADRAEITALPDRGDGESPHLPGRAAAVLQAQIALVSVPMDEGAAGRLAAAACVAGNVLRHIGRAAEAAAVDLAGMDPAALVATLEAVLRGASPAPIGRAPAAAEADTSVPQAVTARALRVDVERIDTIVALTGELIVAKNALGHAVRLAQGGHDPADLAQVLKQQHALLDRLVAELQRSVLAIRVLPLRHVFQRFPRLVREMASSLHKTARLVTEGEATEADKAVAEALFEPLLHVLRNAVDHGVEAADRRVAAGKPANALIHLRGHREGDHVVIEVADDGRGIDATEIRRIAAERGLATADALAALTDEAATDLIFTPGFSTASEVTDLSGRGVGMDAVRTAVERLGGRVSVRSALGAGTVVRFTLPFTVMMTRVMTVEVGEHVFGVPFEAVVETLQLPRDRIAPIGSAEAFVLHGRTVPLINLARALDLDVAKEISSVVKAVVTEAGGKWGALEVNRFGEQLDVMLKPMDGLLAGMTAIAGTTLLGDGRVLVVLDLQDLLQ